MKALKIAYQLPVLILRTGAPFAGEKTNGSPELIDTSDAEEFLGKTLFKDPESGKGTHSLGPQ